MIDVKKIYSHRWTPEELNDMRRIWGVLVSDFFQRFIDKNGTVLDVGAGYCLFINAVSARKRIALDANPAIRDFAESGVEVVISDSLLLSEIPDQSINQAFMSNFLEHLPNSTKVMDVLRAIHPKFIPGGSLLILQPNFRYIGAAYFDFIDHHTILTDKSLVEALECCGYKVTFLKKRFLPYTSKSRLPKSAWLARLYIHLPFLHNIFGQQTFVVAQPILK